MPFSYVANCQTDISGRSSVCGRRTVSCQQQTSQFTITLSTSYATVLVPKMSDECPKIFSASALLPDTPPGPETPLPSLSPPLHAKTDSAVAAAPESSTPKGVAGGAVSRKLQLSPPPSPAKAVPEQKSTVKKTSILRASVLGNPWSVDSARTSGLAKGHPDLPSQSPPKSPAKAVPEEKSSVKRPSILRAPLLGNSWSNYPRVRSDLPSQSPSTSDATVPKQRRIQSPQKSAPSSHQPTTPSPSSVKAVPEETPGSSCFAIIPELRQLKMKVLHQTQMIVDLTKRVQALEAERSASVSTPKRLSLSSRFPSRSIEDQRQFSEGDRRAADEVSDVGCQSEVAGNRLWSGFDPERKDKEQRGRQAVAIWRNSGLRELVV
nr:proline-rich receptor-like protein kinase PERK9 [Aedes albopictus]